MAKTPSSPPARFAVLSSFLVIGLILFAFAKLFSIPLYSGEPLIAPSLEWSAEEPCGDYMLLQGRHFPANIGVDILHAFGTGSTTFPAPESFALQEIVQSDAHGEFTLLVEPLSPPEMKFATQIYYWAKTLTTSVPISRAIGVGKYEADAGIYAILAPTNATRVDIPSAFTENDWHPIIYQDSELSAPMPGTRDPIPSLWFPRGLADAFREMPINRMGHSARFTRTLTLDRPQYLRFVLMADDGAQVRHSLDGSTWNMLIDAKVSNGNPQFYQMAFRPGTHYFQVDYSDSGGAARLCFGWHEDYPHWKTRYYSAPLVGDTPYIIANEENIDFNGTDKPPAYLADVPNIQSAGYAVQWERTLPMVGEYIFRVESDQFVQVYIDNERIPLLSQWPDKPVVDTPPRPPFNATQMCRLSDGPHRIIINYLHVGTPPARIKFEMLPFDPVKRPDGNKPFSCP